jgi:uncharacterized membrane protein YbhN (UPF0104 family)
VAAVGLKNIMPGTGASVVQIGLTKASIERSTFSAVTSAISVGAIFDTLVSVLALGFVVSQGVLHEPLGLSKLAAGPSYFASHIALGVALATAIVLAAGVGFALLRPRLSTLWGHIRQGFAVLRHGRRYLREVAMWQAGSWICRLAAFWLLLDAFGIGGSLRNAVLVQGLQVASTLVPVTPGGAGVQQALLVAAFAGAASGGTVAAYAIGQQVLLAGFSLTLGLIALTAIFGIRSFGWLLRRGSAERAAEAAAG